jgi:hypothetical protein
MTKHQSTVKRRKPTKPPMSKHDATTPPPTSLTQETRFALPTKDAAFHLNRSMQTLRIWACHENGPIRPTRVYGRLQWRTDDIRQLLGMPK